MTEISYLKIKYINVQYVNITKIDINDNNLTFKLFKMSKLDIVDYL
jgi:hypothetical protein